MDIKLNNNSHDIFFIIPDEIILNIFSNLEEKDLSIMELVSKQFGAVANDHALWKKHATNRKITVESDLESDPEVSAKMTKMAVFNHAKEYVQAIGPVALKLELETKVKVTYEKWIKSPKSEEEDNYAIYKNTKWSKKGFGQCSTKKKLNFVKNFFSENVFQAEYKIKESLEKSKNSIEKCKRGNILSKALSKNLTSLHITQALVEGGAYPPYDLTTFSNHPSPIVLDYLTTFLLDYSLKEAKKYLKGDVYQKECLNLYQQTLKTLNNRQLTLTRISGPFANGEEEEKQNYIFQKVERMLQVQCHYKKWNYEIVDL